MQCQGLLCNVMHANQKLKKTPVYRNLISEGDFSNAQLTQLKSLPVIRPIFIHKISNTCSLKFAPKMMIYCYMINSILQAKYVDI